MTGQVKSKKRVAEPRVGRIGDLERIGNPNSRVDLFNETGDLIQQRWYGPDGRAVLNRDWKHKDNNPKKPHKFPHDHPWDWNKKIPRLDYDENRELNTNYY